MKKVWLLSNRHGSVMVKAVVYEAQGSEARFPAGPRALLIKLVSEWKKKDWEVVTVLRNLTSSC